MQNYDKNGRLREFMDDREGCRMVYYKCPICRYVLRT